MFAERSKDGKKLIMRFGLFGTWKVKFDIDSEEQGNQIVSHLKKVENIMLWVALPIVIALIIFLIKRAG